MTVTTLLGEAIRLPVMFKALMPATELVSARSSSDASLLRVTLLLIERLPGVVPTWREGPAGLDGERGRDRADTARGPPLCTLTLAPLSVPAAASGAFERPRWSRVAGAAAVDQCPRLSVELPRPAEVAAEVDGARGVEGQGRAAADSDRRAGEAAAVRDLSCRR